MPLKYWAGMPWAVKQVGMAHGVLFIFDYSLVAYLMYAIKWSLGKALLAVLVL